MTIDRNRMRSRRGGIGALCVVALLVMAAMFGGTACGPTEQSAESTPTADATDTPAASRTPRDATETATVEPDTTSATAPAATSAPSTAAAECVGRCVATAVPPPTAAIPTELAPGAAPRVPQLYILPFSAGETLTDADLVLRGGGLAGRGPFRGTRMIIPAIGVDATFETQIVGANGVMIRPSTPAVVAWYDFSAWPGLGGVPLAGGNSIFAGDYFRGGPGVFARLGELQPGAMIHIYLNDGTAAYYRVDFNKTVAEAEADWTAIMAATEADSLTLHTAAGEPVGSVTYTHRRIVWARRLNCDSPKTPTPAHPEQLGCEQPQ